MENLSITRALERYARTGRPVVTDVGPGGLVTILMDERDAERALADRDVAEKVGAAEVIAHLMEALGPRGDLLALESALLRLAEDQPAPPPGPDQLRLAV